jgi:uncharacterized protein YbjT (DUF2867 family)
MPAKPKVLITGATGQVGALVASYLKADSSVEVIAAARSLEKAKGLGIPMVSASFNGYWVLDFRRSLFNSATPATPDS